LKTSIVRKGSKIEGELRSAILRINHFVINLTSSDQLLRNQSPSVINPADLSERLIATRLIRRIDHLR